MAPVAKSVLIVGILIAAFQIKSNKASAFTQNLQTSFRPGKSHFMDVPTKNGIQAARGGALPKMANKGFAATAESAGGGALDPAAKHKKVRINAFDSMRFLLIAYIVTGHFVRFLHPSSIVMNIFSQINVLVGGFFALSGYVAAYTTSENAERKVSGKFLDTPRPKWILSRIFGYYPLHVLVLFLFSPIFVYPDVHFNGWPTAVWHAILSLTMTQAWFPMHAEVWNAPTWFLSALTVATAILPFALPIISKMKKKELRRTAGYLFLAGLWPKIGYCYDHNAWTFLEGSLPPKKMPNLAIFNVQRFNPFYATVEVLLGAVACRLVMLDGAEDEGSVAPKTTALSTLMPLAGMVAVTILRATEILKLSDLLTRALIFIPLFLRFLMATHRASVVMPKVQDPLVKLLSCKPFVALGGLAFPIFVVHGPVGQLFYKKIIATKLFGGTLDKVVGPEFFYAYLGVVMASAWILQKTFLSSKNVANVSKKVVGKLSAVM